MQKKSHNKKRHRWTGKPRPGLPSSSGWNFPPVSGEGECKFTELYEKKIFKKNVSLGFYLAYYICRQQSSKEALSTCEKCRSAPAGRKLHFLSASGTILAPSAGCAG